MFLLLFSALRCEVWDRPAQEAGLDWVRQGCGCSHGDAEEMWKGSQV